MPVPLPLPLPLPEKVLARNSMLIGQGQGQGQGQGIEVMQDVYCLGTAQILSTASPYHPILKPADGQYLMRGLAEYISVKYGIKGIGQK